MKALIIGATGATGRDIVNLLLKNTSYSEVVTFVRRKSDISHPKLAEIITDFNNLEAISDFIKGDVLFSCLGTTLKAAGSKENQRIIDFDIPLNFAQIAKRNGIQKVVLLSAYGASPNSNVFYSKLKGELEERITDLVFPTCIIFKPGLLLRKNTDRMGEKISANLLRFMNSIGLFRKFQPLPTSTLAEKLVKASIILKGEKHVIELDKIFKF
ncbi:MAG: NAD(P)H-binding protein [Flavobacterium sp.]